MSERSVIWGLGVGPGDPELITLKALKILQAVDVVAYPALVGGESLVRSIVSKFIKNNQEEFKFEIPMVSDRMPAQQAYTRAAKELMGMAEAGKSIAVLSEGDPFFYGSFMYLFSRISKEYLVKIVPGVSSLSACTAELALPLAARNDVVSIIPGPLDEDAMEQKLLSTNVAAIIKVGRHLDKIMRVINKINVLDKAYYIERATMKNQKIRPLKELQDVDVPYFSMVIVHLDGEILKV